MKRFKFWGTKIVGVLFVAVGLQMLFQNDWGGAFVGITIGACLVLLPEKHIDVLLYYVGIVFSVIARLVIKLLIGFFGLFNKGARKTSEGLNDVSARAAGQKKIKCPRCRSLDVTFLENDRKKFSVGKAIGGSILAGSVGSLAGFSGKKGKKNNWRCNECGTTFKK